MSRLVFVMLPLGLGVGVGLATARSSHSSRVDVVDARRPAVHAAADHGEDTGNVEAEIVPEAVHAGVGGESLALRVDVSSILPGTPRYRTAVEIVDDRGHAVVPAAFSPIRQLRRSGAPEGTRVELPAGLANGFYQVHATVGAVSGKEEGLAQASLYVEVDGGSVRLIDPDEFYTRSGANLGVKL
jgi:hypothetical protein